MPKSNTELLTELLEEVETKMKPAESLKTAVVDDKKTISGKRVIYTEGFFEKDFFYNKALLEVSTLIKKRLQTIQSESEGV